MKAKAFAPFVFWLLLTFYVDVVATVWGADFSLPGLEVTKTS